ncbi:MAG TPA: PAS domain S-box protein [Bryobacteraceae bacterium]|nr:PAS domain S-box protein [Bryobacteraceae bacterium]
MHQQPGSRFDAWRPYGIALLIVAMATALRGLLDPLLQHHAPLLFFVVAVLAAAWIGGRGPGLAAAFAGAVVAWFLFSSPAGSRTDLTAELLAYLLFIVIGSGLSVLAGRLRSAARAIEGQAQRTARILDTISDGFATVDADLRLTYINSAARAILGRAEAEPIGRRIPEAFPEVQGTPLEAECRTAAASGRAADFEFSHAGSQRWSESHVYPAPDGSLAVYLRDTTARKRAEQELRAGEHRYSTLAEAIPALVWMADGTGRVVYTNSRWQAYSGSAGQAGWLECIHPADAARALALWDKSLSQGREFDHEMRLRGSDGEHRWFLVRGVPARAPDGDVEAWIGACIDIHERKCATEALRHSEERFRRMVEASAEGIWILDAGARITFANSRMAEMLGYKPAEVQGRSCFDFIEPADHDRARAGFEHRKQGYAGALDYRMRRRDGRTLWCSISASVLADDQGRFMGVLGMFTDITDRLHSELERRQSEAHLRLALEAGHMGTWDWDLDTGEIRWSELHYTVFGLSAGAVKPTYELWLSLVHPDDRATMEHALGTARQDRAPFHAEYRVRWPDGSTHWIETRGQCFYDEHGQAVRMRGVVADATERKMTEDTLRDREKLESVGLLAGGVAHDFNNLLVGILGAASFAQELLPDTHEAAPMLRMVTRSAEKAALLTRRLLAYSGKGKYTVEPLDPVALVRETCEMIRPSLPAGAQLIEDHEAGIPFVEGDADQIQQLVMDLLINASEAVADHTAGVVTVRTRVADFDAARLEKDFRPYRLAPGRYVVLEVADTGPGISREALDKIFDPFFTTKFTGRGMGLPSAQGIVRGHHGGMQVETVAGRGTCFRVLLPYAAKPAEPPPPPSAPPAAQARGAVLVVDDEQIVRQTARAAIERMGLTVLAAAGGEEALEILNAHTGEIVLVLLDMSMPGMSGMDVLSAIRRVAPTIPVLICSGYSEEEVVRRFEGLPFDGILEKPFTARTLTTRVDRALAARKSAGQP